MLIYYIIALVLFASGLAWRIPKLRTALRREDSRNAAWEGAFVALYGYLTILSFANTVVSLATL